MFQLSNGNAFNYPIMPTCKRYAKLSLKIKNSGVIRDGHCFRF